jgi:hypothetical protein
MNMMANEDAIVCSTNHVNGLSLLNFFKQVKTKRFKTTPSEKMNDQLEKRDRHFFESRVQNFDAQ